jgi:hypothetical protein
MHFGRHESARVERNDALAVDQRANAKFLVDASASFGGLGKLGGTQLAQQRTHCRPLQ